MTTPEQQEARSYYAQHEKQIVGLAERYTAAVIRESGQQETPLIISALILTIQSAIEFGLPPDESNVWGRAVASAFAEKYGVGVH